MSCQPCGCDEEAGHVCERCAQRQVHEWIRLPNPTGVVAAPVSRLPTAPAERKTYPLYSGLLKYFPRALAEVAHVSWIGNEQHNPGEPLHWAREKSRDQEDCLLRHLMEKGTIDSDGARHSAKMCWRALAILELELESELAQDAD